MGLSVTDRRQMQFVGLAAVLAVLIAAGVWVVAAGTGGRHVTAYFSNASALFEDNQVEILGVPVGKIDKITPEGKQVRVDMTITDKNVKLPANVNAVVISPSLVTGRYVQFTPAYDGGPELADGATIPIARTAVPLGVDDLARTATQLSRALGPNGANKTGALNDLLDVGAKNLDGNGQALNTTITKLGDLSGTLAGSSDDLFGTVTQLEKFTSVLAQNDGQVREFNGRLADVSGFLAGQRTELGSALSQLGPALADVSRFVKDNRSALKSNVDGLSDVTATLVDQQKALTEVLDVAPAAVNNLVNTYNGSSGTLDTRPDINELTQPPLIAVCQLLTKAASPGDIPSTVKTLCDAAGPIISGAVPLPSAAQVLTALYAGQAPPVPGLALPTVPAPAAGSAPASSGVAQAPAAKTPAAGTTAPSSGLPLLGSLLGGGN
ncbi:MAG: MCE family protein [Pseudonocardia sp.]|uniref:MCE family protein n=1 Tax=Pseudonocardia sp. TaxID=60912 RepID=UPI001AC94402|nr:MCE family protein [Pseudonocardia sp.]MBN9098294.1 MCE family protein [Pseudonocardia sp.]